MGSEATSLFALLFGVPALSRHLVLAAGISLRPVVPLDVGKGETGRLFRYHILGIDGTGGDEARFIEFGFALKYLL